MHLFLQKLESNCLIFFNLLHATGINYVIICLFFTLFLRFVDKSDEILEENLESGLDLLHRLRKLRYRLYLIEI